ncbi:S9 family peptidase [Deinococcus sp. NW-56]|uniref:alpha/beta hydrolase family protein n=1 Tax=Deinococcus sp. NW-56 TaxID=2080419 RepID=UPI000CF44C8E|nr:prolyl oligopeptidase family serine peptidase [Deinococcus sp. NW-56]
MTPRPLTRLRAVPPQRLLGWAALAYAGLLAAGAVVGSEVALRSKTRRVKGAFVPVRRQGDALWLPALPETLARGVVGVVPLRPGGGHALLGPGRVMGTLVRREIRGERGLRPQGALAWVSSFVYNGTPAQLGVAYEDTAVPTPVGDMPAWHIPPTGGERDGIVIVIHGHGGQRSQALRMLPALRRTGTGALFVTFRNAFGAPRVGRGYHTLGDEEAEDVLAALAWAREAGYRRAVLYGFSMGGNIALSVLRPRHEPFPLPVTGVMLDCPALEWRGVLRAQAGRAGLPPFLARQVARGVERLLAWRSGQNLDTVDQLAAAGRFNVPILLWHGTGDRTIPVEQADALAAARPDLVEYHRVAGARHIRVWNLDPEGYDHALEQFIHRVLPGSPSSQLSQGDFHA